MLADIQHAFDLYEKTFKNESKWLQLLESQIEDYERTQTIYKQQRTELREKFVKSNISNMDDDINELKNSLDPVAVNIYICLLFLAIFGFCLFQSKKK